MERPRVALVGVCLAIAVSALRACPLRSAERQGSQLNSQTEDDDKKPTKYSAAPAEGDFEENRSDELVPDQDRRVVEKKPSRTPIR
jgi:hypothetical protein